MQNNVSTKEEILDAAYIVLVERGYDGFTTQAVADEADRNQSLVHYYFETKQDLVFALLEKGLTQIEKQMERVAETDDPADRLLLLAEYLIDTSTEESLAFKRMILELTAQAPYDEEIRKTLVYDYEQLLDYTVETVCEGIEDGIFRDVDPNTFAVTYLTLIRGAQFNAAAFGADTDDDLIFAGLRAIVRDYLVNEER